MPGAKKDQSAYRSELAGNIATLSLLDDLVCYHNITAITALSKLYLMENKLCMRVAASCL